MHIFNENLRTELLVHHVQDVMTDQVQNWRSISAERCALIKKLMKNHETRHNQKYNTFPCNLRIRAIKKMIATSMFIYKFAKMLVKVCIFYFDYFLFEYSLRTSLKRCSVRCSKRWLFFLEHRTCCGKIGGSLRDSVFITYSRSIRPRGGERPWPMLLFAG